MKIRGDMSGPVETEGKLAANCNGPVSLCCILLLPYCCYYALIFVYIEIILLVSYCYKKILILNSVFP